MAILQSVETERALTQRFGDGISEMYKVYINSKHHAGLLIPQRNQPLFLVLSIDLIKTHC